MKRRRFVGIAAASAGSLLVSARHSWAGTPRIGVVGAGIVGASVAQRLARRGAEVTLFEKDAPAAGATGRSFAWLNAHFSKKPHHYHLLNRLGIAAWRELEAEFAGELGLRWGGTLEWAAAEPAAAELRAGTRDLLGWGYAVRAITAHELTALAPRVVPGPVAAASFAETEGAVDAALATRALLRRAESDGARLHSGCEVRTLEIRAGRLRAVETTAGRFALDRLVIACGVGTPALAAQAGLALRLKPAPGLVLRTEPLPRQIEQVVVGPGVHARQAADGRILVGEDPGPPSEPDHSEFLAGRTEFPDPEIAERHARRLLAAAASFLPGLTAARVEQLQLCLRPVPVDGYPALGPAPACPDVYAAVTHSGVTLGPLLGRLIAQELLDGASTELLEPYRPTR
jgi:glycine/D-amino acid oxidase-like deaminating enzyme